MCCTNPRLLFFYSVSLASYYYGTCKYQTAAPPQSLELKTAVSLSKQAQTESLAERDSVGNAAVVFFVKPESTELLRV